MESNVRRFLEKEIAVYNLMDENEFIDFAMKLPLVQKPFEQTILYIYSYLGLITEPIKRTPLISRELQRLQDSDKYNIIISTIELEISTKWIPVHRTFFTEMRSMDQHLHKNLINVLRNPDYNRFEQYPDLQCINGGKLNVFLWQFRWDIDKSRETNLERSFYVTHLYVELHARFPNITFFTVGEYFRNNITTGYYYYYHENNRVNYFSRVDPLIFIDLINQQQDIHLNFDLEYPFPSSNPEPFTKGRTIDIIVNDELPKSPVVKKDKLSLWEEDIDNPIFIKNLIERMNNILCGKDRLDEDDEH